MAYINKNDFSILSYIIDEDDENYFECDDMIAPTISLLNKKGYRTAFCCSGHPFPFIDDGVMKEEPSKETIERNNILSVESSEKLRGKISEELSGINLDETPYYVIYRNELAQSLYIAFEDEYNLPELPEGIDVHYDEDNMGLYLDYTEDEVCPEYFVGITKVYEANKKLYEWAKKLPILVKGE